MIFALLAFVVFFICMSVGLLVKGTPVQGSCGKVAALMGDKECKICGGDPVKCQSVSNNESTNK